MTSRFVEALPEHARSFLRIGGSGEGYVGTDLEIRLDSWVAAFRPTQFRDGWLDFGFGQEKVDRPDPALVAALDSFVAAQAGIAAAIPHTVFPSIPMLRESFEGFAGVEVLQRVTSPDDLFGVLHLYAVHANRVAPSLYVMGAFFFSDWDDNIGLGFLFDEGRIIAAGEGQLAETTWMARAALDGTLTLTDAYWLP